MRPVFRSLFSLALLLTTTFTPVSAGKSTQPPAPPARQQAAGAAQNGPLPRVYLFATGGTISNRDGGRLTVEELIKSVPNLAQRVRAEGEQFSNVSSG